LSHFIYFIENEIHRNKNILEKTSEFHLLHGHLARNNERKHILINNKKIFIVDWEGALFGDKEYEIAAFLYENDTLPLERKKNFLNEYLNRETISKRKLKIYKFLIRLDDFAESIKKYLFKKERAEAKDIYSLNKEIISLEKEIALW
jgi:thiamine kinase-like enzyme